MRRIFCFVSIPAAAGLILSLNVWAAPNRVSDTQFAREAMLDGLTQIDLGQLALQKSGNPPIKALGQRLVDDQVRADNALSRVAAKDRLALPPDLDARHKAMVERMSNLSSLQFDRNFVHEMVKDQKAYIARFQEEASAGRLADLRSFAGSTLPALQSQLNMATAEARAMGERSVRQDAYDTTNWTK